MSAEEGPAAQGPAITEPSGPKAQTIKFKNIKQQTEWEVEVGSPAFERMKAHPEEYTPLSPIAKEPDRPAIIDGDAQAKKSKK